MHMIGLHVKGTYRPGVRFTDTTNFLFDQRSQLANENLFAVFRTSDKIVSQLVGDVFGVLCIHTQHDNKCSSL